MFIGGIGGAGIAIGTSMAMSLRSHRNRRGGTLEFPLSTEVYDAFKNFKAGQVHYYHYVDEEKRVQDAIAKAEASIKKASAYAARKEPLYEAPSSDHVSALYKRYKAFAGHLQEVQDLGVAFTMPPYRPEMPIFEKISSALNTLRGNGKQDSPWSYLMETINQRLADQKSKLENLVDTASKMADNEKQRIESIVRTFQVSRENYQALAEVVSIFLNDSALVWTRNIEHVGAIARLKKEAIAPHDMVNYLWEPMTRIIADTVATGKEQDIDLTLRTFQANMKVHTELVERVPAMDNHVGNQNILTMLASLKNAQREDMNHRVYQDTEQEVRSYLSKIAQKDYTAVLNERKTFIESNSYADAFGLLNRLQKGLDSQQTLDVFSDKKPAFTLSMHASTHCFNEIQSICATGLTGEKPEGFDALLTAVGTGLLQYNAAVSQNVDASFQI